MKDTKLEFKFFSVPEWKKEEKYLREQHKNGWEFVKVNGFCLYHFRKCEPRDIVYQLDYNPDSNNNKSEYIQMFSDCGWEYLQDYVGYSYFRKAVSDMDGTEEEIFCDDASRLDLIKRVFVGRMIPLLVIFFLIIIPQIILQSRINTPGNHILTAIFIVLLCIYLLIFISVGISFWKYYNSAYKKEAK